MPVQVEVLGEGKNSSGFSPSRRGVAQRFNFRMVGVFVSY
jgi:hypothetical protein